MKCPLCGGKIQAIINASLLYEVKGAKGKRLILRKAGCENPLETGYSTETIGCNNCSDLMFVGDKWMGPEQKLFIFLDLQKKGDNAMSDKKLVEQINAMPWCYVADRNVVKE